MKNSILATASLACILMSSCGADKALKNAANMGDQLETANKNMDHMGSVMEQMQQDVKDQKKLIPLQELMKEVSKEDLPVALRGASPETRDKFLKNMSSRAAEMLKDDMESKGPVKISDVEKAQQNILKVCRKLEEEGRIVVAGAGEEML